MKKLLVMVIALAVVFGMSAGVMAGELSQDTIQINASIAEKATIDIDGDINFDINELDGHNESYDNSEVTIRANTPVKVTFEEDLSRALANILGDESLVWAFDGSNTSSGFIDEDNWVVSPNVLVTPFNFWKEPGISNMYPHQDGMAKDVFLDQGYNELEVGMEAMWRQKDNDENMLVWYDLLANEEITANVTVTVAAN